MANFRLSTVSGVWVVESGEEIKEYSHSALYSNVLKPVYKQPVWLQLQCKVVTAKGLKDNINRYCTSIAEVMGSIPVQARIFSGFFFSTAYNKLKHLHCDDLHKFYLYPQFKYMIISYNNVHKQCHLPRLWSLSCLCKWILVVFLDLWSSCLLAFKKEVHVSVIMIAINYFFIKIRSPHSCKNTVIP